MTNPYFTNTSSITRGTLARGEVVAGALDSIEAGFDMLPTEGELKQGGANYVAATGPANTYVAAPATAWTSYAAGRGLRVKWPATNTGASTINVSGLGAVSIKRIDGNNLSAGDIVSGGIADVVHDGSNFRLISMHGSDLAATTAQAVAAAASASAASSSASSASSSASAASASAAAALVSENAAEAAAASVPVMTVSTSSPTGGADGDLWFQVSP
jgi:hypothetical protein